MRQDRGMGTLRVAVAQTAPGDDLAQNRAITSEAIADAAARGAQLVVLPEYSNYYATPFGPTLLENSEPLDGPFVTALQEAAAQHAVTAIAGMLETGAERVSNTLVAVNANGIITTSRKQHLYDAFGQKESEWVAHGPVGQASTFELGGFTLGLMTCYDLRFPEVARTLVDAGADVIVVPAQWVPGPNKQLHWETLLRARAIENISYVLAADHAEPNGIGLSQIIGPTGETLGAAGTTQGLVLATLDSEAVQRGREVNPALGLRRYRVVPREGDASPHQ